MRNFTILMAFLVLFGGEVSAQTPSPSSANGGSVMVNISAPITSQTMLELVRIAQDAVAVGVDAIQINMSSPGGKIGAARFAVNALSALPLRIDTVAMSEVSSAAVALFCSGDRRYIGEGASIYLHQLTRFAELSRKTAAALSQEDDIVQGWYDGVLHSCVTPGTDLDELDYSNRDVVIDAENALRLGIANAPFNDLKNIRPFGRATNIIARETTP